MGDGPEARAEYDIDLRGMRADEAESVVQAAIDNAVIAEQPHSAHRFTAWALRRAARHRPGLACLPPTNASRHLDFAPRQQGGVGVTVAVLR